MLAYKHLKRDVVWCKFDVRVQRVADSLVGEHKKTTVFRRFVIKKKEKKRGLEPRSAENSRGVHTFVLHEVPGTIFFTSYDLIDRNIYGC